MNYIIFLELYNLKLLFYIKNQMFFLSFSSRVLQYIFLNKNKYKIRNIILWIPESHHKIILKFSSIYFNILNFMHLKIDYLIDLILNVKNDLLKFFTRDFYYLLSVITLNKYNNHVNWIIWLETRFQQNPYQIIYVFFTDNLLLWNNGFNENSLKREYFCFLFDYKTDREFIWNT